jgi:hypothetical protein
VPDVIHADASDVRRRLAQMGLEDGPIAEVVRRGYVAFASCTSNDPPLYPGFTAWAQMVRGLREYLLPKQWQRSDESNYSLVINPAGTIAIAVATGDDATGRADATPTTKSTRGPCTIEAVTINQSQLELPFDFPALPAPMRPADPADKRLTWILLVHRAVTEIRCELSLPLSMGDDSRIESWRERIILASIPIDPDLIEVTPPLPDLPDITVDVKRRA